MASKGTAAKGKNARAKLHYRCRRCGQATYHKKKRVCSSCGYGSTPKMRKFAWQKKKRSKRR